MEEAKADRARATSSTNVDRTVAVIQRIAQKYADPSYWQVVTSLALLNEPATYLNNNLLQVTRQFWYDAYGAARYPWSAQGSDSKSGLALVISDGFQPLETFEGYMTEPNYESVSRSPTRILLPSKVRGVRVREYVSMC